jgi:hypothetical protein
MNLNESWVEFERLPFPDVCAGEAVEETCLVSLDSAAAGCISTFVGGGQLDTGRVEVLKHCATELERVLPKLAGECREYFVRLAHLVTVVLQETGA